MIMLKDYILIDELKDDIIKDGITIKYDDNNQYMFSTIIDISPEASGKLSIYYNIEDMILLTKRIAKLPFMENYIISFEDVIGIYTKEEYEKLIKGEV